jgi:hypothetical protein
MGPGVGEGGISPGSVPENLCINWKMCNGFELSDHRIKKQDRFLDCREPPVLSAASCAFEVFKLFNLIVSLKNLRTQRVENPRSVYTENPGNLPNQQIRDLGIPDSRSLAVVEEPARQRAILYAVRPCCFWNVLGCSFRCWGLRTIYGG